MKSVFEELDLGMEMNTSSKFSHGQKTNNNQFCWKEDDKSLPYKSQNIETSKGDCAKGWKGETFPGGGTGKISNTENAQVFHEDSVFYDLGLVSKKITSPTRSCIYT